MVSLTDALRPYWARNINATTVNSSVSFSKWLESGLDYTVPAQITPTTFELQTSSRQDFLKPISQDCNRFMSAAIESIVDNEKKLLTDKAVAWDIIKNYYASFYAAHFIIRVLGYSLTQLDTLATTKVEKIADAYGNKNGVTIERGFYLCDYTSAIGKIACSKMIVSDTGSHGALWRFMSERMEHLSRDILAKNSSPDYQAPSLKLADLVKNLRLMSANGNWLSTIRNDVNYKHLYGCWFPYKGQDPYFKKIKETISQLKRDPMTINLAGYGPEKILRFFATTTFIVALGLELSLDLRRRCPMGKSFVDHGVLQFMRQLKILV